MKGIIIYIFNLFQFISIQENNCYIVFISGQDCELSPWSEWSKCQSDCGKGVQKRKRHVVVSSAHGGKPCGHQRQKRVCYVEDCYNIQSVEYSARELKGLCSIICLFVGYIIRPTK